MYPLPVYQKHVVRNKCRILAVQERESHQIYIFSYLNIKNYYGRILCHGNEAEGEKGGIKKEPEKLPETVNGSEEHQISW